MFRALLLVLLLAILPACAVRHPETPGPNAFTLMTSNINWGMDGAAETIAAIRRIDADVICLQETTPAWEAKLRNEFAGKYRYAEFRESVGRMGGGLGILSKYPVTEIAYVRSDTGWFDGWVVRVETPGGPVQLVNVHLQPPASDEGGFTLASLLFTDERRTREIERLHEKTSAEVPLVIAGDFNDSEGSGVVRWLEKRGMTSALGEFDRTSPTWNWRLGLITLERRMDHVVYRGVHCYEAYVKKAGASDHFPVVAILGRKVSPGAQRR